MRGRAGRERVGERHDGPDTGVPPSVALVTADVCGVPARSASGRTPAHTRWSSPSSIPSPTPSKRTLTLYRSSGTCRTVVAATSFSAISRTSARRPGIAWSATCHSASTRCSRGTTVARPVIIAER